MADAGLVDAGAGTGGAEFRLTPEGSTLQQRVREGVAQATSRLYAGIDPDDLATTRRVLVRASTIAARS